MGVYRYLGADGKEYAEKHDAIKYGGGLKGQRYHDPVKRYEPVPYDAPVEPETKEEAKEEPQEEASIESPLTGRTPGEEIANNSQALMEFDHLEAPALREILRAKGYLIKGNPSKATLLEKLKQL